jgi:hypothetical protein
MVPPADLDRLSHAELKGLVIQLFEMMAEAAANGGRAARRDRPLEGWSGPASYQAERHGEGDRAKIGSTFRRASQTRADQNELKVSKCRPLCLAKRTSIRRPAADEPEAAHVRYIETPDENGLAAHIEIP